MLDLSVPETARAIREGALSPVELVEVLLARIERLEPALGAWVAVDRERALAVAAERAADVAGGRLRGPLHGIPVGLKDIYHASGMMTTAGAGPFAHELPAGDAAAVARLRAAGAIVLGKTVTTEFAFLDPAGTRNPWNPEHTPGGSSSGSAAAVAARMVPLALGSQTVGSTLRPAAYCGIVGLKPTHGRISCAGMVPLAWSLDHVGLFGRRVADVALLLEVLAGDDPADPWSARVATERYGTPRQLDRPPRLGVPGGAFLGAAGTEVVDHLGAVAAQLERQGASVAEVALPGVEELAEAGLTVLRTEAAAAHAGRFDAHAAEYRPLIRGLVEAGRQVAGVDYALAQRRRLGFRRAFEAAFEGLDALLTPVAATSAPRGLAATGDPRYCAPWTYTGLPSIALPSGVGEGGLPLGVQLAAPAFEEVGLLAVASWCEEVVGFTAAPPLVESSTAPA